MGGVPGCGVAVGGDERPVVRARCVDAGGEEGPPNLDDERLDVSEV